MIQFFWVFLALILVFMNAFFVAAEFGMVKLRHTRVKEIKKKYGWQGRILAHVHAQLDAYLSACQLGITLASLGLGWVGEPAFAYLLEPLFELMGIVSPDAIKFIAFFTAFTIISFLHIVVGELMPKSIALRQSEKVSLWTAVPLYGFYWLMYPAIKLLNASSNFLLEKFGLSASHYGESVYSSDEIKLILSASHRHGELTLDETAIIEHTLDLADIHVSSVMRPVEEIVAIDINMNITELMQFVFKYRYSRYPVYDKARQEIIGIIHIKDLFDLLYQQPKAADIKKFIRPVLKVFYDLPALELLRKFKKGQPHFALVYSGHSSLIGFVTLDNLLHVLLGRIKDEFHRTQDAWIKNPDGSFTLRGDCSIYTLEQALHKRIPVDNDEINTVAGLILDYLGTLPEKGQKIEFKDFIAEIEEIEGAKFKKIKIYPKYINYT